MVPRPGSPEESFPAAQIKIPLVKTLVDLFFPLRWVVKQNDEAVRSRELDCAPNYRQRINRVIEGVSPVDQMEIIPREPIDELFAHAGYRANRWTQAVTLEKLIVLLR